MTKIAYNARFGGFGLSNRGFEALLRMKGIEWEAAGISHEMEYWLKGRVNEDGALLCLHDFYDNRTDPDLIAVIEDLGPRANGYHADLKIVDLPVGTKYYIHEYDGAESIVTSDQRTETA